MKNYLEMWNIVVFEKACFSTKVGTPHLQNKECDVTNQKYD
jgi:hypothetical protein